MNNGRPKAVLFDWDNTLIDSWPVIFEATNATLTEFGHDPWTLEEIKGRVRKSLRNAFPEYYGDRWQEAGKFTTRFSMPSIWTSWNRCRAPPTCFLS